MNDELHGFDNTIPNELESTLMLFNQLAVLANNFCEKSPSQIFSETSGLSLTHSMLSLCRSFFRNTKITEKELFILNAFADSISASPSRYSIESFRFNDPLLADTYRDIMQKYADLYPEYNRPCDIERMLRLGGEAVSAGLPRQFSSTNIRVSVGKNDLKARIKRYFAGLEDIENYGDVTVCRRVDALKFRERINSSLKTVIIYSPRNSDALFDFCKSIKRLKNYKITVGAPYELFLDAIYSFTGIQINTALLPIPAGAEHIPPDYRALISVRDAFFSTKVFGECAILVTGKAKKIEKLSSWAKKQGLLTSAALQPQNLRLFSINAPKCTALKFKTDPFKMLYSMAGEDAVIPYRSLLGYIQAYHFATKIYENAQKTDAVYKVSLDLTNSDSPFKETLLAVTELALSAVKDGYSMKDGLLALSVSASLPLSSPEKRGFSMSAVIGIYRAVTELGIPMEDVATEVADNDINVTLSLRAFSNKKASESFPGVSVSDMIYYTLEDNLMPDFEIFSKFCRGECVPEIK